MTTPADTPPHTTSGHAPAPAEHPPGAEPQSNDLLAVRRCDVEALRDPTTSTPNNQGPHGGDDDQRYPSTRELRTSLAFVVDVVLHAAAGIAALAFLARTHPTMNTGAHIAAAVGAFIAASLVHRVLIQWGTRATLGKALTGLTMIRAEDGGRPTLWLALRAWLVGTVTVVAFFADLRP